MICRSSTGAPEAVPNMAGRYALFADVVVELQSSVATAVGHSALPDSNEQQDLIPSNEQLDLIPSKHNYGGIIRPCMPCQLQKESLAGLKEHGHHPMQLQMNL